MSCQYRKEVTSRRWKIQVIQPYPWSSSYHLFINPTFHIKKKTPNTKELFYTCFHIRKARRLYTKQMLPKKGTKRIKRVVCTKYSAASWSYNNSSIKKIKLICFMGQGGSNVDILGKNVLDLLQKIQFISFSVWMDGWRYKIFGWKW